MHAARVGVMDGGWDDGVGEGSVEEVGGNTGEVTEVVFCDHGERRD